MQRLHAHGVDYKAEDPPLALVGLEDASIITRVQRQPFTSYPQFIVAKGRIQLLRPLRVRLGKPHT